MRSSWGPHKTVIELRAAATVNQLFGVSGRPVELEGNAPQLLIDHSKVWFVDSGAVDLFFVDIIDGKPSGRRRHFVRVEKDEMVMGVPLLPTRVEGQFVGLLAVGIGGTKLLELTHNDLRRFAKPLRGAMDSVHNLIDTWIKRLWVGLCPGGRPRGSVELQPDVDTELKPDEIATASAKIIWVSLLEGTVQIAGQTQLVAPPALQAMIPLSRVGWFESKTPVTVRLISRDRYYDWDTEWTSLTFFHQVVLATLARIREAELEHERTLFVEHDEVEKKAVDEAIRKLAVTYKPDLEDQHVRVDDDDPLVAACRQACAGAGMVINAPPASDYEPTVEEIARASQLRVRKVLLGTKWWKAATGPMVSFSQDVGFPVGLVPKRGKYHLYDPLTSQTHKINSAVASNLIGHAWQFYRPFPARALTAIDVLRYAFYDNVRDFISIVVAGLLVGLFGLVVPYASGELIDRIIPAAELGELFQMGLGLMAIAVASTLTGLARDTASLRIETRASSSVQAAVWDRLMSLPVPFFRQFSSGDLAVRANGIDSIRQSLSGSTMTALLSSVFSLTSFGLLLFYSVKLAAVAAALALGSVVLAIGVGIASVRAQRKLETLEGRISSLVLELLTGISKLRIAGAEVRAFNVWAKEFSKQEQLAYDVKDLQNKFDVVEAVYPLLSTIAIFYIVAQLASAGTFSTGSFMAFNAAYGMFISSLLQMVGTAIDLAHVVPTYERAKPMLEAVPEVDEAKAHPGQLRGEIRVSHVRFRYAEGTPPALDDVDFTIAPGEFVAVVGTSASGKSTLLRVMLGFEQPQSGGVFYDGQELSALDVTAVRRQLGVVLQNGELMAGDIYENISGSRQLSLEEVEEAVAAAGLEEDIAAMPMGLHTVISQGGRSLSGGQRQRLLIARAIATAPRMIYFDEATSALDNRTQAIVSESLDQLQATRVVVAHRLSTIKNADRIIVLERGRVVQMGVYDDLVASEGVFAELAKRQIA